MKRQPEQSAPTRQVSEDVRAFEGRHSYGTSSAELGVNSAQRQSAGPWPQLINVETNRNRHPGGSADYTQSSNVIGQPQLQHPPPQPPAQTFPPPPTFSAPHHQQQYSTNISIYPPRSVEYSAPPPMMQNQLSNHSQTFPPPGPRAVPAFSPSNGNVNAFGFQQSIPQAYPLVPLGSRPLVSEQEVDMDDDMEIDDDTDDTTVIIPTAWKTQESAHTTEEPKKDLVPDMLRPSQSASPPIGANKIGAPLPKLSPVSSVALSPPTTTAPVPAAMPSVVASAVAVTPTSVPSPRRKRPSAADLNNKPLAFATQLSPPSPPPPTPTPPPSKRAFISERPMSYVIDLSDDEENDHAVAIFADILPPRKENNGTSKWEDETYGSSLGMSKDDKTSVVAELEAKQKLAEKERDIQKMLAAIAKLEAAKKKTALVLSTGAHASGSKTAPATPQIGSPVDRDVDMPNVVTKSAPTSRSSTRISAETLQAAVTQAMYTAKTTTVGKGKAKAVELGDGLAKALEVSSSTVRSSTLSATTSSTMKTPQPPAHLANVETHLPTVAEKSTNPVATVDTRKMVIKQKEQEIEALRRDAEAQELAIMEAERQVAELKDQLKTVEEELVSRKQRKVEVAAKVEAVLAEVLSERRALLLQVKAGKKTHMVEDKKMKTKKRADTAPVRISGVIEAPDQTMQNFEAEVTPVTGTVTQVKTQLLAPSLQVATSTVVPSSPTVPVLAPIPAKTSPLKRAASPEETRELLQNEGEMSPTTAIKKRAKTSISAAMAKKEREMAELSHKLESVQKEQRDLMANNVTLLDKKKGKGLSVGVTNGAASGVNIPSASASTSAPGSKVNSPTQLRELDSFLSDAKKAALMNGADKRDAEIKDATTEESSVKPKVKAKGKENKKVAEASKSQEGKKLKKVPWMATDDGQEDFIVRLVTIEGYTQPEINICVPSDLVVAGFEVDLENVNEEEEKTKVASSVKQVSKCLFSFVLLLELQIIAFLVTYQLILYINNPIRSRVLWSSRSQDASGNRRQSFNLMRARCLSSARFDFLLASPIILAPLGTGH